MEEMARTEIFPLRYAAVKMKKGYIKRYDSRKRLIPIEMKN